jgi:WD40 repeat protein
MSRDQWRVRILTASSVIVSCSFDNTICLFDTAGRGTMRKLTLLGHTDAVVTLCLSAKSELIISSGTDCSIRLWDVASSDCIKIIWTKVPATCLDVSADSKYFVGNQFNDVCVWSTAPEESVWHVGQKAKKAKASGKRQVESAVLQTCVGHTADVLSCKLRCPIIVQYAQTLETALNLCQEL